ncbi:MAG: DUF6089 family protein [Bacteroidales bacterium]
MKKLLIIIGILTGAATLQAQRYIDINVMGGFLNIHTNSILPVPSRDIYPAGGLFVRYGLNTRYALRGGVNGAYKDGDTWVVEGHGLFEFNFHPLNPMKPRTNISPYIATGISYLYDRESFLTALRNPNSVIELEPDNYSGAEYWIRNVTVPFHVGVRYLLASNLTLGAEWAIRRTYQRDWVEPVNRMAISEWRSFVGITLGYSFVLWESVRVPFY